MLAEISTCQDHNLCIKVIINDCEFHTGTKGDRKVLLNEIEWMDKT